MAPDTSTATDADALAAMADIERLGTQLRAARSAIGKVIYGQQDVIDQTLVALLSGGHLLLIGVPGLAKTLLVETLGVVLGMEAKRIQFTPDLMPADILGSEVMEETDAGRRSFRFIQGPVFAQLLMADEINRASPRTQSALLQSMQEKHVTVAGKRYDLPGPFHVLATQNPVEFEGTFPLPEAQLDRFLVEVGLGYPTPEEEAQMLQALVGVHPIETLGQVVEGAQLPDLQAAIWGVHIEDSLRDYIIRLANATRHHPDLALGASPRATFALFRASQALAALSGRDFVLPDDIKALAQPTWRHRLLLRPESALRGRTAASILDNILSETTLDLGETN